jgi:hypothetical protein
VGMSQSLEGDGEFTNIHTSKIIKLSSERKWKLRSPPSPAPVGPAWWVSYKGRTGFIVLPELHLVCHADEYRPVIAGERDDHGPSLLTSASAIFSGTRQNSSGEHGV